MSREILMFNAIAFQKDAAFCHRLAMRHFRMGRMTLAIYWQIASSHSYAMAMECVRRLMGDNRQD